MRKPSGRPGNRFGSRAAICRSPDPNFRLTVRGSSCAYHRTQDDIAVVNRDGTNWRDLTNDKFFDRIPRRSPDGKKSSSHQIAVAAMKYGRLTPMRPIFVNSFDTTGDTSFPLGRLTVHRFSFTATLKTRSSTSTSGTSRRRNCCRRWTTGQVCRLGLVTDGRN